MLGVSRAVIVGYVKAGLVSPSRGPRNSYRFEFQDVVLLRTAIGLRRASIPTRRIRQSLDRLRKLLPASLPLTGLRITAVGDDVAVSEGERRVAAETGQLLLDLEIPASPGGVVRFAPEPSGSSTVDEWIALGESREDKDPAGAGEAYLQAIALDPLRSDAWLNYGALLHERGDNESALALFDRALVAIPEEPDVHFNRAVILEDLGRTDEAIASYERCLALDPDFADAHWNAARLYDQGGVGTMALQHFSAFRRLQR